MRLQHLFWLGVLAVPLASAVYEDEAFHTDYHIPLLGTVTSQLNTFFHKPTKASPASLLYSLTNRLVLGAINPKDGSIVWRQQLGSGSVSQTEALNASTILRKGTEGNVVTAVGGEVGLWDAGSGKKIWGNAFAEVAKDLVVCEKENVIVVASQNGVVRGLDVQRGHVTWETRIGEGQDEMLSLTSAPNKLTAVLHQKITRRLKTVTISANTGAQLDTHIPEGFDATARPVHAPEFVPIAAWQDGRVLKINVIGTTHTETISLKDDTHVSIHASTPEVFVVSYQVLQEDKKWTSWAEVYSLSSASIKKTLTLPSIYTKAIYSTTETSDGILISCTDINGIQVYTTKTENHVAVFRFSTVITANPQFSVSDIVKRADGTYATRTSLTLEDGNLAFIRNGDIAWTREESLASAVASEWVELRDTEPGLERALHEEERSNIVQAYVHRVTRHLSELERLPQFLAKVPDRLMVTFGLKERKEEVLTGTVRDTFGLRKLVVFVTRFGYMTAIDTGNKGTTLWRLPLGVNNIATSQVRGLFALKKGVFVLVLENRNVYEINVYEGTLINQTELPGTGLVESSSIIDSPSGQDRWVVIMPQKDGAQGWAYPRIRITELREAIKSAWLTQRGESEVRGLKASITDTYRLKLWPTWSFPAPSPAKISYVATRPPHDPIASIGKVMGDRSVHYKYLNKNLLLVTTIHEASSSAVIYLLDSISGNVLYSVTQPEVDTSRPIVSTVSEHWFVYSFYSTSTARGPQLVISELYTSPLKNDRGFDALSAHNSSALTRTKRSNPFVISQSYVFPHQIVSMTTTTTRQGITTRSLLLSVPAINSLVSLPKRALDPRRPTTRDTNNDEKEEGLFKYEPVIGVDFQRGSLSHKRELFGVYKISTSPASLESTCLVLGWGLDVFGTRTNPSEAFDILGKGFNKPALLATVAAFAIATMVLAPMVRRKQINQQWIG